MTHASDSTEQLDAESYILKALSNKIGVELSPNEKIDLSSDSYVKADGLNRQEKVLCEIYAHIGKLKGSQPDKIASDFLKMLLIEKIHEGAWQKHFCFACNTAASILMGNSWLARATTTMGILIHVFKLPSNINSSVVDAQKRQKMVNK